jgi:hypothetical protein
MIVDDVHPAAATVLNADSGCIPVNNNSRTARRESTRFVPLLFAYHRLSDDELTIMDPEPGHSSKWYLVTVGVAVGVFRGWSNVGPLVLGYPQSVYCRVESRNEGIRLLNEAMDKGTVRII